MRTINIQIDVVYSFRKGFQGGGAWLRPFFYNHLALWEFFDAKEKPELSYSLTGLLISVFLHELLCTQFE